MPCGRWGKAEQGRGCEAFTTGQETGGDLYTTNPNRIRGGYFCRLRLFMEYFIWCDESVKKGKHYSNFYGGVLVSSTHVKRVTETINKVCAKQNLRHELK